MSDEPITVKKLSGYVMMSREELDEANAYHAAIDAYFAEVAKPGYVPPKPWKGPPITPMPEAYGRLLSCLEDSGWPPLIREVLELHGPKPGYIRTDGTCDWRCEGCDVSGYEWEHPDWPCETTAIIARHLGVEATS